MVNTTIKNELIDLIETLPENDIITTRTFVGSPHKINGGDLHA